MKIWLIAGFIVIAVIIIYYYNSLIGLKNQVENIEGSLDAILKKRSNLIPALINIVKEYMEYESNLLKEIVNLRSLAINEKDFSKKLAYEEKISSLLSNLLAIAENYPDLKTSQNFLQLQYELSEVEAEIAAARRALNQAITDYNNGVEMFPSNIFAKLMGLKRKKVFAISEEERKPIDVKKLFNSD